MACVYCYRVGSQQRFKIGHTKRPPEVRRKGFATGSPEKFTLHRTVETENARQLEKYIHWLLDARRTPNGEFFDVTDAELEDAIQEAESFVTSLRPVLQAATRFARVRPVGSPRSPSDKALILHRSLREAERQKYLLNQQILFLQSQLKIEIADCPGLTSLVQWEWQERHVVDEKRLKRDYPQIYDECRRVSVMRVFRLLQGVHKLVDALE